MTDGPLQCYRSLVFKGALAPDTAQELAAEKLQLLANRLAAYTPPGLGSRASALRTAARSKVWIGITVEAWLEKL